MRVFSWQQRQRRQRGSNRKQTPPFALPPKKPKKGLLPQDVDILVTNCSIYCPTPSLASMLINKFKFKPTVLSFHLGGMGCGNGVVAIGLLRDLLKARPNATALFVPAEITSYSFYAGECWVCVGGGGVGGRVMTAAA